MKRDSFTCLSKDRIIYNNEENKILIVNSTFIDPDKVTDEDVILAVSYFDRKEECKIKVSEHEKWNFFNYDTFINELNQDLINRILLQQMMGLNVKINTILETFKKS